MYDCRMVGSRLRGNDVGGCGNDGMGAGMTWEGEGVPRGGRLGEVRVVLLG